VETGEIMMFEGKEQIWCSVGDEYDTVAYDADTPCKKGNRLFLLREATREDGDFKVYSRGGWYGPVGLESKGGTYHEQMYLNFYFPLVKWPCKPKDEHIEKVRKAVEKALSTEEFKQDVDDVLDDVRVSVVARTNAYYGH
jgi:hypothetical protein